MRTVEIKGLKELNQALAELPRNIAKNALRGSVRAAAQVIKRATMRKAPVVSGQLRRAIYEKHIPEKSGALRQTFYVGVRQGKRYQGLVKKKTSTKNGVKTVTFTDASMDAYYGKFVEFGHFSRHVTTAKGGKFARTLRQSNRGQRNNEALAEMVQTGAVKWVPPKPFMRPAWDAHQNDALKKLSDYLEKRIPEEAAKVRK